MKDNQNKKEDYLGSKFSEHVFGDKGGQVMDPYDAMRQIEEDSTEKFWRDMNVNNQYEKKETLSDKNKFLQRERMVSSSKILGFDGLRNIMRNHKGFYELLTPEEKEAIYLSNKEFKREFKKGLLYFSLGMLPILYMLRKVRGKGSNAYYFLLPIFGLMWSFTYAGYTVGRKTIIRFDKLGKEYTLGRIQKQSIFDKRKDISQEVKQEIYMKMRRKNEEFEENLYKRLK